MEKEPLKDRPSKVEVAGMPPFVGLALECIHVLKTAAHFKAARAEMQMHSFIGFDTETKPTFQADEIRDGPHLVQIALPDKAFIVHINETTPLDFLRYVVESESLVKVGFGLKSDRGPLRRKLGLRLDSTVELTQVLRMLRFKQALGVKAAVSVVFGQRLHKPKNVTLSDWSLPRLGQKQLIYAANDAYAALRIFQELGSPTAAIRHLKLNQSLDPNRVSKPPLETQLQR